MKKRNPTDHHARPNQVIQVVATRSIRTKGTQDKGAFQYLRVQPSVREIKYLIGKGKYLGYQNQVTAFVWLDDEPQEVA